jgi:endoglucanase
MKYLPTLYPGDAYVDWTCLDGYNWAESPTNAQPWRSFDRIFAPGYKAVAETVAPKKPVILAELASHSTGGSKPAWIRNMMKLLPRKYPKIRGLIWFDSYDRGIDWPLETSPASLREFSKGVLRPNYAANIFSTLETRPIRPLR